MTDTPETDKLARENHVAHPTVWAFCRKFERERDAARDSLARHQLPARFASCVDTGQSSNQASMRMAYSGEAVNCYITYWCEVPELPQL